MQMDFSSLLYHCLSVHKPCLLVCASHEIVTDALFCQRSQTFATGLHWLHCCSCLSYMRYLILCYVEWQACDPDVKQQAEIASIEHDSPPRHFASLQLEKL